jgi:hypothetical protein
MFRISLLLLLLISSCSIISENTFGTGNFPHSNKFYERFPANKKAIVIMKYDAETYKERLLWCKFSGEDDEIKNINDCREIGDSDSYKILMFEPGIYKLADYAANKKQYVFGNSRKSLLSKLPLSFEVKSAEIAYVGLIKKKGASYEIIDEFDLIERPLKTKNYQELKGLFSNSLKDIEWFVKQYHASLSHVIKRLVDEKKKVSKNSGNGVEDFSANVSCDGFCNKEALRKREKEINSDKEKYSNKYFQQLISELNFDKERCGLGNKKAGDKKIKSKKSNKAEITTKNAK